MSHSVSLGVEALVNLDFCQHDVTNVGSMAILMGDLQSRTGIYWLKFDDGYEYVGQSVEVVNRLATHRRHQPGKIISVSFAPVPAADLDAAERWFIQSRDEAKARLRNKLITRTPGGPGPGAFTVRPGLTVSLPWERHLRAPIPLSWSPVAHSATPAQARQFERLQAHEKWPEIRAFLRAFVRETMSAPDLTVGRLWTISAMPNTVRLPGWYRLCTLNVGRIEAVYIGEDATAGVLVDWNVAVPEGREGARLERWLDRIDPKCTISTEVHEHYAEPVQALEIPGAKRAHRLLDLPVVADLAYRFNTRYQRQGMALQSRGHNHLMATDLLRKT